MLNNSIRDITGKLKLYIKTVSVQIPRPLRIPESGEITPLSSLRKAVVLHFTVVVNGLATILATQSLQLGAASANSAFSSILIVDFLVVIFVAIIVVLIFF